MSANHFPYFVESLKGQALIALSLPNLPDGSGQVAAVHMGTPGTGFGFGVSGNTRIGFLTGRAGTIQGVDIFEFEIEFPIFHEGNFFQFGFINNPQNWRTVPISQSSEASSVIDELIRNNQTILERNLFCARAISLLESHGIAVPQRHRQMLFELQTRLNERNSQLANSTFLRNHQTGEPEQLTAYQQHLQNFMRNPGIGLVLSTTAVIIIAVTFLAAYTGVIVMIFRPLRNQSTVDIGLSAELTRELANALPRELYDQLMREIADNQRVVDRAIAGASFWGRARGFFSGTAITLIAGGVGAFLLVKAVTNNFGNGKN